MAPGYHVFGVFSKKIITISDTTAENYIRVGLKCPKIGSKYVSLRFLVRQI